MYRRSSVNRLVFNGLCVVKTAFLGCFRKGGVKIFRILLNVSEVLEHENRWGEVLQVTKKNLIFGSVMYKKTLIIVSVLCSAIAANSSAQAIRMDVNPAPVPIDAQQTQSELRPGWKIVDIQLKSKIKRYLWGAKAKDLCETGRPSFIVCTDSLLLSDLVMIRLKQHRDYRSIPKPNVHDNKCVFVDLNNFVVEAYGEDEFRITPIGILPPGEYIFTWLTSDTIGDLDDWIVYPFSVK